MLHYHGTPITPKSALMTMAGENFCISYVRPDSLKVCQQIGQSLMFDNGAFSAKTRGFEFDLYGFYEWLDPILAHPHWGVVPDVIDGTVEQQKEMVKTWPFPKAFGVPVWHLGLPIDYLLELVDDWGKACLGSSGEYWQVGSPRWSGRMDEVFNQLVKTFGRIPWLHGMRMLGQGYGPWPLASADSTNVALNHAGQAECAGCMAKRINSQNPSPKWHTNPLQEKLSWS